MKINLLSKQLAFVLLLFGWSITANCAVTSPLLADSWHTGSTHNITWDIMTADVSISLHNGGGQVAELTPSTANDGEFEWIISNSLVSGVDYFIEINDGVTTETSGVFELIQSKLLSPNGGEYYYQGFATTITWNVPTAANVLVELYDGATLIETIDAAAGGNSVAWTVPVTDPAGSNYKVKITQGSFTDESDAVFSITAPLIVTQPNTAGLFWAIGTPHNINWTGGSGTGSIDLYKGGIPFVNIALAGTSSGYSWIVPAHPIASDYKIVINDDHDGSNDMSDNNFTITNPIVLTAPNGGQIWYTGSQHNITWTDGSGTATIKLYKNGSEVSTIASGVASGYLWTVSAAVVGSDYTIVVVDNGDGTTDVSDANFRITFPVVVTSPNGGETYANLSNQTITWTGGTDDATIELLKNGVAIQTLSASHASPFSWSINTPADDNDYKIRVTDNVDLSTDNSNANFTITQYVLVGVPTVPGIRWNLGTTQTISWSDNIPGSVVIDLYYNGVLFENLAPGVADGTTTFDWLIPTNHQLGNLWKIKIYSSNDGTIVDMSDHYFRIDAATNTYEIEVLQPSLANIHWTVGETYLVSWNDNLASNVKVELVNFGVTPATIETISASTEGSTVAYTVPGTVAEGAQYKVMITSTTDNAVIDLSDNYFEISVAPEQTLIVVEQPSVTGLTWIRGSTYVISWTDNVPNNNVTINLLTAADGFVRTIASNVPGSTYYWYIDPALYAEGTYKVQVVYGSEEDKSNFFFTISNLPGSPSIDILQPDVSGITWLRGESYLISWEDNIPGPVDIYYYRSGGGGETLIDDNVVGSTYVWTIPALITEAIDYRIKVYATADHDGSGYSANDFAIQDYLPGGTMEVLQPDGGETWVKGNSYYISWDDNFDESVNIELVNDATVTTSTIISDYIGSTYVWTIPNNGTVPAGILYKVKITSSENSGYTDMSDGYFTIVDPAASPVVYPNPANQSVTVTLNEPAEEMLLTITNRFDMQLVNRTIQTSGSNTVTIPTAELPAGLYFISLTNDTMKVTHKLIIQH